MKIVLFIILAIAFSVWVADIAESGTRLDPETGLIIDLGYKKVAAYCIGCHTGKMIIEHRGNYKEWQTTLQKMQKIAGRWNLEAETKKVILDYLSKNYGH